MAYHMATELNEPATQMPITYLRTLTKTERTDKANRRLGCVLAFVAGAANAGGFLAVGQYTSHMSGIVSSVADNLALGKVGLMLAGISSVIAFAGGAATSALLINWARGRNAKSGYALPLFFEAILMLCFGLLGSSLCHHRLLFIPVTIGVLCFAMGLQKAMITKISKAEIRTTHMTGIVTDIGIELGKLAYWNRGASSSYVKEGVHADLGRLGLLASLLSMFLFGGLAGAQGFERVGYISAIPLAAILLAMAVVPIFDDFYRFQERRTGR